MARWIQNEKEWEELAPWKHLGHSIMQDKDDNYWFVDETEANACGPYITIAACTNALDEYARTL